MYYIFKILGTIGRTGEQTCDCRGPAKLSCI